MSESENNNSLVYLLAGFGLGAIVGAAAGVLFAPKAGSEMRSDIADKAKELKGRTEEWIKEQRAKRLVGSNESPEEVGA